MFLASSSKQQNKQDHWQAGEGQRGRRCSRVRKPAARQGGARGGGGVERARVPLGCRGTSWVIRGHRAIAGALRHMMCERALVPCIPPHPANTRACTCQRSHRARPLVATITRMVIALEVCWAPMLVARLPSAPRAWAAAMSAAVAGHPRRLRRLRLLRRQLTRHRHRRRGPPAFSLGVLSDELVGSQRVFLV